MRSVDFQPLGLAGIYIDRETGGGCNSRDAENEWFMTVIIIELVIVLVGLALAAVLFYRIPTFAKGRYAFFYVRKHDIVD